MLPRRQRGPQPEVAVSFVRAGNVVKTGHTSNLARRLRVLATGSAVPLELLAMLPGNRQVEARLHRQVPARTLRRGG
jgi:hypothetical protein